MGLLSVGDMAKVFQMRRQTTGIKDELAKLTSELTTGRQADLAGAVSGDFKALAGLENSLTALAAYKVATSEAALFTKTAQIALETVQDMVSDIAPSLASAATTGTPTLVDTTALVARQNFHSTISALNAQVGDRYAFSGLATDAPPLPDSQDMLDTLTSVISGQVTVSGLVAAVTDWFDAPPGGGGYLDTAYGGSLSPLPGFRIGAGDSAPFDATAADDRIRTTLKGLALGALVAEGAMAGNTTGRAAVLGEAGKLLTQASDNLALLRAEIGASEGQIEKVGARNAAEAGALEIARNQIVAADPYETATALEAAQTQLETIYQLTARLSRLSLADFLK